MNFKNLSTLSQHVLHQGFACRRTAAGIVVFFIPLLVSEPDYKLIQVILTDGIEITTPTLSATDVLAPTTMKNAAKCDT